MPRIIVENTRVSTVRAALAVQYCALSCIWGPLWRINVFMYLFKRPLSIARFLYLALACAALAPSSAALAQHDGFEAGLRLGYGVPIGTAVDNTNGELSDLVNGQIPIWLDVGYRFNHVFIGAYGHYGIGLLSDQTENVCDAFPEVDCSTTSIRVGLQLLYDFQPAKAVRPWIGLGVGYEWLTPSIEGGGASYSLTASGFELANVQVGVDFELADHVRLGPFVSFSLDQFSTISVECSGLGPACGGLSGLDGDIDDKSIHQWFVLGVRAAYGP